MEGINWASLVESNITCCTSLCVPRLREEVAKGLYGVYGKESRLGEVAGLTKKLNPEDYLVTTGD